LYVVGNSASKKSNKLGVLGNERDRLSELIDSMYNLANRKPGDQTPQKPK
jgi:nitrogen-specific signal transduction histidine kinase